MERRLTVSLIFGENATKARIDCAAEAIFIFICEHVFSAFDPPPT